MVLAFLVAAILSALMLFWKKRLLRRDWYILFSTGLVFTLFLSLVLVGSVWNPYGLSTSLPDGTNSGASVVSYPLWMSVYVTPLSQRVMQGGHWEGNMYVIGSEVGNVSFDVFIGNGKVLETNGTFSYGAVYGPTRVEYQLGPPFSSNAIAFFAFLLFLFTSFNMVGFVLGLILCWVASRKLASHLQATSRSEPVTSVTDNRT